MNSFLWYKADESFVLQSSIFCSVFLAFLVAQAFGHIYRLPCKKFAEFSIVEKDSGLNSDATYKILDNTNKNLCREACIRESECKAFSTNGESCELHMKTTEDSKVNPFKRGGSTTITQPR